MKIYRTSEGQPEGSYINITTTTPTPWVKTNPTTSIGPHEGLRHRKMNMGSASPPPSGGPTMNIKGTAASSGLSLSSP